MHLAISKVGDVFMLTWDFLRKTKTHVAVWRKSTSHAGTYEVLRTWGSDLVSCPDGIVITEADDGYEVVCVSDRTCVVTFRLDGSLLRVFGIKHVSMFPSLIATAFRHVYVANSEVDEIAVFTLDGTLLFQIDVPCVWISDMALLADELFVLVPRPRPNEMHRHLHVYSAHDGTPLRTTTVTNTTLVRTSPSEGLLWLLCGSSNTAQCMRPDFTLFHSSTPITASISAAEWSGIVDKQLAFLCMMSILSCRLTLTFRQQHRHQLTRNIKKIRHDGFLGQPYTLLNVMLHKTPAIGVSNQGLFSYFLFSCTNPKPITSKLFNGAGYHHL